MIPKYKRHRTNKKQKLLNRFILSDGSAPCFYCDQKFFDHSKLTMDHVIPRCKGGMAIQNNLVLACQSCNDKKSNKPSVWRRQLKRNGISQSRIGSYMNFGGNRVPRSHRKFNI